MNVIVTGIHTEIFVKRMFFLAYQACGKAMGMGLFKAVDGANEEKVWKNIITSGDYATHTSSPGFVTADYVFGRMMKLCVKMKSEKNEFEFRGVATPRADYQEWSSVYPTYKALVEATVNEFGREGIVVGFQK